MREVPEQISSAVWMLDPSIVYLNHGSFGARTEDTFNAQLEYKRLFELSPVDFLDRHLALIHEARSVVANFVGASVQGFGFVENATTGVGCVIRSLDLHDGDEILATNHVYNGVRQLLSHHCRSKNMLYREVDIPVPVVSSAEIISLIRKGITKHTKVLVVDHIASSSSIVFPVSEIVALCKEKGVFVLIDGAHAPGMLELNIDELQPDWYVGNLHKWVCAPLGAAFIWANETQRNKIHPMTISHGLDEGLHAEFDWQGTRDISAWLAAADAVRWGSAIGWSRIREHNHAFVLWMQEQLLETWGVAPLTPIDGSMLGSMATVQLPKGAPNTLNTCLALRDAIYEKYALEVPIFPIQGLGMLRISAQLYTKSTDLSTLVEAIEGCLNQE